MDNRTTIVLYTIAAATLAAPAFAAPAKKPAAPVAAAVGAPVKVFVRPSKIKLVGRGMSQRFLVFAQSADGRIRDVTSQAKVTTAGSGSVRVEAGKVVTATDGDVTLTATVGAQKGQMAITVDQAEVTPEWSFANEIVPIFTKSGCNTGGCHGSPSGRGTFRLSLFGYEPDYDYDMITKDKNGARINKAQPATSLLLSKPTMTVPHGGGMRFKKDSEFYTRITSWLKAGAPKQPEFDPRLSKIEVYPSDWTLDNKDDKQQIVVMAVRDDGSTQDVTDYARFTSNDDQVVEADDDGVMTAAQPGETSIMIRYLGGVGLVTVRVPRPPVPASAYANFKPNNYIDQLVLDKFKEVRITPSDLASDSEFMRRAYIDTCGITPSVEEARAFLDSKDPNKRTQLIDSLLNRPEYVDFWTLKWSDLLRNNQLAKQDKGLQVYYHWIRDSIRDNKPYNQFVRELLTASGSGFRNGPVNWFNTGDFGGDYPLLMASATSQVFLGIRIDCARCHNHPFEAWSQMDYYGLASFFARTGRKPGPDDQEQVFFNAPDGDVKHPRTNAIIQSKFLGGDVATFQPDEDRREKLADWITNPNKQPWFTRSISNRLWNNFFGRGIVHPVDDYRLTNPASNEALLEAMGNKVVEYKFDLKKMMRDILMSRTYQSSSIPNKLNVDDRLYASHALPRRLYAEVLLDAVVYATDVPEKFGPYEYGRRAISIPDNRVGNGFLDLFGRAKREIACECERNEETNVSMVLNLLNGGTINQRISAGNGRVARAAAANKPQALIEEFYLATLCRRPDAKEQAAAQKLLSSAPNLKEGAEDLMWSLLNMREFLFNH